MNFPSLVAGILMCSLIGNIAYADSEIRLRNARLTYASSPGTLIKKVTAEKEWPPFVRGDCFEIYTKNEGRYVGRFCSFPSLDDILELGIHRYADLSVPLGFDTGTGLVVGTPMMYYPMEKFKTKLGDGAGAEVDCDLGDGPVYRATSTCHVGLVDLKNGEFLYGFLALRNHVSRTNFLSYKELANMWGGFIKD